MAVLVEAVSVIINAEAIESQYPGGWSAFEANPPNATLCADGELIRVGFMSDDDARNYVQSLAIYDIVYLRDGKAVDLVIADQLQGFAAPCDWAEFGRIDWEGDPDREIAVCRKIGSISRDIHTPEGWKYKDSISQKPICLPARAIPEFMDFLREENGMEVFHDLRTGKEVYVGRTSRPRADRVEPIRLPEDEAPEKLDACRAYARMMNTLDSSHLEPWLADDCLYTSQWVKENLAGKQVYLEYIRGKLYTIKRTGNRVWAEIAYTDAFGAGPCVVLSQDARENLTATLLIKMNRGKISQMTMCGIPSPHECRRTGELPV